MRIIAGRFGSRMFDSPGTHHTHPMSDKMRGALFNALGDLQGLTVLDPFGGSGALSFEAISRGAASAIVLDSDKAAQRTIQQNIRTLDLAGRIKLVRAAAGAWRKTSSSPPFDIVLCDPPYNDLQPTLLTELTMCVKPGGIFVLSYPIHQAAPRFDSLEQIKQQAYGDAQLIFYRAYMSR